MKPTCTEIDRKLWLYIDRELSASELAKISAHLRECEVCSGLYHERVREARLYRSAFAVSPFGDKFAGKLRRQMLEDGLYGARADGPTAEAMAESQPPRTIRRPWRSSRRGFFPFHRGRTRRLVTVAAMLLLIPVIVLVGHLSNGPTQELLGELVVEEGVAYVATDPGEAGETEVTLSRPRTVCAGMVCRVASQSIAHLKLRGAPGESGSRLLLTGPAVLSFDAKATRGRFLARLEEGDLEAYVTRRAPGEVFRIETPHARAVVVGTIFELSVKTMETLLEVREGKVKFQDLEALPGEGGEVDVTPEAGPYRARLGESKLIAVLATAKVVPEPAVSAAPAAHPPTIPKASERPVPAPPSDPQPAPIDDLDNPVDGK